MENTYSIEEKELNYEVFNALNLYSPLLGEAYANFDWNPLGDDFKLDLPYIEKYLQSARYKPEEKKLDFLEKDPKAVHEAFSLSAKRNKQLIAKLKQGLEKGDFNNYKGVDINPQVKDILFFLECRQKMLEISIGQLKSNKINPLAAYKNINGINRKLSQLLEETYAKEFNEKVILENLILQAQLQNKMLGPNMEHTEMFEKFLSGEITISKDGQFIQDTPILDFVNNQLNKLDKAIENNFNQITPQPAPEMGDNNNQSKTTHEHNRENHRHDRSNHASNSQMRDF